MNSVSSDADSADFSCEGNEFSYPRQFQNDDDNDRAKSDLSDVCNPSFVRRNKPAEEKFGDTVTALPLF